MMSGFSTRWLASREPVDLRARNDEVIASFAGYVAWQQRTRDRPLRVLDLGAGTGATMRALAPHLPADTTWRLAEHDTALLERAIALADRDGHAVEAVETDLSRGFADETAARLLEGVDAVTTSAFLDLVSHTWLEGLARALAARRLPFLAMLTFDGRQEASPSHPLDARIREAMAAHQGRDKGFGPALGPAAHEAAADAFRAAGFALTQGSSDWEARRDEADFQSMLISGWASAARETGVDPREVDAWLDLRLSQIAERALVTRVGHQDLAALPG